MGALLRGAIGPVEHGVTGPPNQRLGCHLEPLGQGSVDPEQAVVGVNDRHEFADGVEGILPIRLRPGHLREELRLGNGYRPEVGHALVEPEIVGGDSSVLARVAQTDRSNGLVLCDQGQDDQGPEAQGLQMLSDGSEEWRRQDIGDHQGPARPHHLLDFWIAFHGQVEVAKPGVCP